VFVRSAAELEWIKDVLSTSKAIKLAEKYPDEQLKSLRSARTYLKFKSIVEAIRSIKEYSS
jgi:hypothetical protein